MNPAAEESSEDEEVVNPVSDGPNASAKWSKYGMDDGKLVRKAEFCPSVDLVFFSPFTQIVNRVDAVDTPSTMSNLLFFGFDAKKRIDFVLIIDNNPVTLLQ